MRSKCNNRRTQKKQQRERMRKCSVQPDADLDHVAFLLDPNDPDGLVNDISPRRFQGQRHLLSFADVGQRSGNDGTVDGVRPFENDPLLLQRRRGVFIALPLIVFLLVFLVDLLDVLQQIVGRLSVVGATLSHRRETNHLDFVGFLCQFIQPL